VSGRTHLVVRFAIAIILLFVIAVAVFIADVLWKTTHLWTGSVSPIASSVAAAPSTTKPVVIKPAAKPAAKRPIVPALSVGYRLKIERAVSAEFGLLAPVALVAAQLQQESGFNPKAQSPYAIGLAQFTPATAKWLPTVCPHLGDFDPWNADQSIAAAACYDAWLHRNVRNAASACDRFAFMLSDYNGGTKWRQRDQAAAAKAGSDSTRWFGQVETSRSRSEAAHKENRAYVRRILQVLTPAYAADGWPGGVTCT
jgi:soluble lytic murein transglycosylase-like protein